MRRFLGVLVGATILTMPLIASGHRHIQHEFFVYCGQTTNYMVDATVTISYEGGFATAQTRRPHGNVTFRLPGTVTEAQVVVDYPGYCTFDEVVPLDSRPRKGGRGYWIDIYPGCTTPER
jgi:hypothetical protein